MGSRFGPEEWENFDPTGIRFPDYPAVTLRSIPVLHESKSKFGKMINSLDSASTQTTIMFKEFLLLHLD